MSARLPDPNFLNFQNPSFLKAEAARHAVAPFRQAFLVADPTSRSHFVFLIIVVVVVLISVSVVVVFVVVVIIELIV